MKLTKRSLLLVVAAAIVLAAAVFAFKPDSKPKDKASANPAGAAASQDNCVAKKNPTYACYKSQLTNIVNQSGAEQAFALVKDQYTKVAYVKSQCHQLTHVIGRATYAKYNDLGVTFAHGDQFCWSGFYHGIMEQIAIEKGTNYIIDNANSICKPIAAKQRYSFNHYNCVHGMGHGFMEALEGKLFDSLKACDKMTDDWERNSCYGGVFMQNIMYVQSPDETSNHTSPYLKADQPMYPCTAVDSKYKEQCYLMQTSYALQVENYDFSKVFTLCTETPQAYRQTCYQSLGRDASGQSISNIDKTSTTCLSGSDYEAQSNCIIGAAKDFVSYFHSDRQANQLCASLPPDLGQVCTKTVVDYYKSF